MEQGITCAARIEQLAADGVRGPVYWHIPVDDEDLALSWSDLWRWSGHLASAFTDRGLGHGDRLAIGLRNSPQFVVATFAAWRVGAVPVPLRWDLPDWELARVRDVIAAPIVLGADDVSWIDAARFVDGNPSTCEVVVSPNIHGICSSGSTGTPKVILSNLPALYNEALGAPMVTAWQPIPRPQKVLVLAPMYHANGFSTLYSLLAGDHLMVMEKFDAARAVDVIESHRVTTFTATPTMLKRIADLPDIDQRDLSSIDWVLQGAASMPPSLVHRWIELIGPERLIMAYGMTEGLGITALRGDEWLAHPGSVGRGIRETELRILDTHGQEMPMGEIGDVYLRSPMYGGYTYLGGAPMLRGTDDGFHTAGDMGCLGDDGYLYLADRRVDMIISGGANVFPAEVEAALIDHPKVADVVVIGLRDEEWGRRVHAVVEPRDPSSPPTRDEVVAFAKSRLAAYKVPKSIEVVDVISRSAATKVSRALLVAERGG